jgi:hypothetical protein
MKRYREGSKMDQVMADPCVKKTRLDAVSRLLNRRNLPTPFACTRWGRLATFPQWLRIVGPLYEHEIRLSQRIRPPLGVVFVTRGGLGVRGRPRHYPLRSAVTWALTAKSGYVLVRPYRSQRLQCR